MALKLRYLIVNADDFGYTPGVNRGIIEAHEAGIVTSTSVMVNMPYVEDGLQAAEATPRLGLGLHLNLTAGQPISPVDDIPHLVGEDGLFHPRHIVRREIDDLPLEEIRREFEAQLTRFEALTGKAPDHLDSHHHVTYMTAPLHNLMVELADERSIPVRRGYPQRADRAIELFASVRGLTDKDAAEAAYAAYQEGAAAHATTDHITLDYYGQHTILGDLLNALIDLPEGVTELMCHPGYVDDVLREASSYVDHREQELRALTARSARELLTSEGIVLITFGQLANVTA